jgi:hypothetical protein
MGLDMYLSAKRYMWYNEKELKQSVAQAFPDLPEGVEPSQVEFKVGYWRKANAVHKWFVDNVQGGNDDCGDYWVSEQNLNKLLSLCKQVVEDPSLGPSLLPTQSGCFFGNTDYGDWYMQDIADTIEIVERALLMREQGYDLEYHSSW